jgi:phosphatidylglycerophosphatase A
MEIKEKAMQKLTERGITIDDMAILVFESQLHYNPNLTMDECIDAIINVLGKREVIHTILTGIALDEATEKHLLEPEINKIIEDDTPLYGIDEIIALSIVNIYGSIALTNFGYLDKVKPGIIGKIDKLGKESNQCHTFLDDIVGAIVAAAISRTAHH